MSPVVRQRIYIVLTALLPVLAAYGVIADTDVALWLALGGALLGSGGAALAAVHTPTAGRHSKDNE